jgi:nitrous oxidase accessory protein
MKVRAWGFLLGALLFVTRAVAEPPRVINVPGEHKTIAEALSVVPDGGTVEIAPGMYSESLVIDRPVVLRGGAGEVIISGEDDQPVITITGTNDVTVHGLTIQNGEIGILVYRGQNVFLRNNVVRNNRLVGIKVRMAQAAVTGNTVVSTQAPYGKGIHITNTMEWPTSLIQGNMVSDNARGGIVTNMAMVRVIGNVVRRNGQVGVAIIEMTEAVVADNEISGNGENGMHISDRTTAIVCNNVITSSLEGEIGNSPRYGNGITIDFISRAELHYNVIIGNANHAVSVLESSQVSMSGDTIKNNGLDLVWLDETSNQLRNIDLPLSCE